MNNSEAEPASSAPAGVPRGHFTVLFWVLQVIAMIPILLVKNIPFADYSNHVARLAILVRDRNTELFPYFYHENLKLRPYLGFDAPALLLSSFLSVDVVGKVFCVLTLTLWSLGIFRLSRHFDGVGLGGCIVVMLTFNMLTMQGFLPFFMGLALVPWYLLVFAKAGKSVTNILTCIAFALLITLSHQLAIIMFLAGGAILLFDEKSSQSVKKIQLIHLVAVLSVGFIGAKLSGISSGSKQLVFGDFPQKAHNALDLFNTGSFKFDMFYVVAIIACISVFLFRGTLRFGRLAGASTIVGSALFVVWPSKFGLAENIDYRFLFLGVSFAIALCFSSIASRKEFGVYAGILVTLMVCRSTVIYKSMHIADDRIQEARNAMKSLPEHPGIMIATVGVHSQWEITTWKPMPLSVGAFSAIDRTTYVNNLFQEPSMMTIAYGDVGRSLDYIGRRDGVATGEKLDELVAEAKERVDKLSANPGPKTNFFLLIVSSDLEPLPERPTQIHHGSYFSIFPI